MAVTRYTDRFLNALLDSHHVFLEARLWYGDSPVDYLPIVNGSVRADRGGAIRTTASLVVDPNVVSDPDIGPRLNPYGSTVKIRRGIRYADGSAEAPEVFTGRIDAVGKSIDGITLQCSDLAATVIDRRFTRPYTLPRDTNINTVAETLIKECWPAPLIPPDVVKDTATSVLTRPGQTFEQERGEALDSLMKTIGSEWFADQAGVFHLKALPAVIGVNTDPVWIVDSGDLGVLVENTVNVDRQGVANYVVVDSEPVGGVTPAHGEWSDTNDQSATWVGGPYGQVTAYFTGQPVNTTAAAEALAKTLLANSIAKVEQVSVSCIPNPKLKLGDVVRVYSPRRGLDKMFFVQSFDLPLDPETPMTMTLHQTLTATAAGLESSPLRVPEGSTWQPHP